MFDVDEALRSGTFISGMPGSGKSNLAKCLVKRLLKEKVRVFVFDPSEAWIVDGPIKKIQEIERPVPIVIEIPRSSLVYDIKILYVSEQQTFVQRFCQRLFMQTISLPRSKRVPTVLVFEESQVYLPEGRLKGKAFEEVMRILNLGRNFNHLRIMILTQFAANVDKKAVKPCGQKYMGFTDEPNDLGYLSGWVKKRTEELAELEVGEFFYRYKKILEKIKVPFFTEKIKPKKIVVPLPSVVSGPMIAPTQKELFRKERNRGFKYGLYYGIVFMLFLLLILYWALWAR